MSARAALLPDSVEALNRLLDGRADDGRSQKVALGLSYLTHAALFLSFLLIVRHGSRDPFSARMGGEAGVLEVMPLYSAGAPPGPAAPRPAPAPAPRREEAPAAAAPAETDDDEVVPERRAPRPRATPPPSRPAAPAPAPGPSRAATPAVAALPGGGSVPAATGGPGSPTGSIHGSPEGGFQSLLFTNQWYVLRVRDLVYSNWANPFSASGPPRTRFDVVVRFRIQRDGSIGEAAIEHSSGDLVWDRAGLRAVEYAKLPPLPPDYRADSVVVYYSFDHTPRP